MKRQVNDAAIVKYGSDMRIMRIITFTGDGRAVVSPHGTLKDVMIEESQDCWAIAGRFTKRLWWWKFHPGVEQ